MSARILAVAALCCGLLQPVLARDAAPVPLPEPFDAAQAGASLVDASNAKLLKGVKRVAIPQFFIEFATADQVSAQTSGFAAAGRASVTGYYRLVGVDQPEFQAIADQLYAGLVQALQAQGFEVLTREQLGASPTWSRLNGAGIATPMRSDSRVIVAPPGMALYGVNRMMANAGATGLLASVQALGEGVSGVSEAIEATAIQKELDGAALLDVSMKLHFAQLKNENRGFLGRLSSTASISAKLHPVLTQARLQVLNGADAANFTLKAPLLLDPAAFSEVRKEAATTGEVAAAVATGLLRMAIGNKDSSSSEKYQVVADPAQYRERIGANLAQTHAMLIARMVSER